MFNGVILFSEDFNINFCFTDDDYYDSTPGEEVNRLPYFDLLPDRFAEDIKNIFDTF